LGELDGAREALHQAADAHLPAALQVPFDSLGAWNGLARGDSAALLCALAAMADNAARAPETRYPNIVDMGYGHYAGLPGARPLMQRLQRLCRGADTPGAAEVPVPALDAWLGFWHGEPRSARAAWQALLQRHRHLPGDVMLAIGTLHLHSLHLAVQGRTTEALAAVAQVQHAMTAGHSSGWRRSYLHVQARIRWRAEDAAGLAALLPGLVVPRTAREWPVLDTGAALVQGQHALLTGQLATARAHLQRATLLQRQGWLPAFMGDARLSLALCCALQGESQAAARELDAVLAEVALEDSVGALLLEPPERLQALWQATEGQLRTPQAQREALRQRVSAWLHADDDAGDGPSHRATATPASDDPLSEREREVLALLAEGQSNKLIARSLGLSPHTVKRHVANILTKLALDSRTQAAAHWHRR
jgi:LuxR family maltose regulon positive regulatory protein